MGKFKLASLKELGSFAEKIMTEISPRQILLLTGPVGVGKTEFVRALTLALGGTETFSPSFAIHNRYEIGGSTLDHLDLYRIESPDDLESTGFWDLFAAKEGLIVIEWADRLDVSLLPHTWQVRTLEFAFDADPGARIVSVF